MKVDVKFTSLNDEQLNARDILCDLKYSALKVEHEEASEEYSASCEKLFGLTSALGIVTFLGYMNGIQATDTDPYKELRIGIMAGVLTVGFIWSLAYTIKKYHELQNVKDEMKEVAHMIGKPFLIVEEISEDLQIEPEDILIPAGKKPLELNP